MITSDALRPTPDDLRKHLDAYVSSGDISRYAVPDRFEFVQELPRTSVGKIDKKALKERAAALVASLLGVTVHAKWLWLQPRADTMSAFDPLRTLADANDSLGNYILNKASH